MPNYRILESGDSRVLENGTDFRIIEPLSYSETISYSGVGLVSAYGNLEALNSISLAGAGSVAYDPFRAYFAELTVGTQEYIRETDTSDIRITDPSDTRITDEIPFNVITTMAVFSSTYVPFDPTPWVKHSSTWKEFLPYIKYNGSWVVPSRMYVNDSGSWRRVY